MDSQSLHSQKMQNGTILCLTLFLTFSIGVPTSYAGHDASKSSKSASKPRYPSQIIGVWMSGVESCNVNQTYDSERIMEVTPRLLIGYEQTNKPTKVSLVSQEPLAWRVDSMLDVGPSGVFEDDDPRLFVLGTDRLTVVTGHDVSVYVRCR